MFEPAIRAILHPTDYVSALKKTTLTLKERVKENDDTYSFIFTATKLPKWKVGQHSIFSLPNKKVNGKNWRAFSVASAPHENEIRIGTIITSQPSSFKKELLNLRVGEKIKMNGPFGEMYIKPNIKNIVAIAGGIGITPFRAILSELDQTKSDVKLHLIYADNGVYTYADSLNKWQQENPNLTISYTKEIMDTQKEFTDKVAEFGNNAHYFISGSPGFIESIRRELRSRLIKPQNILNDPFKGY